MVVFENYRFTSIYNMDYHHELTIQILNPKELLATKKIYDFLLSCSIINLSEEIENKSFLDNFWILLHETKKTFVLNRAIYYKEYFLLYLNLKMLFNKF